MKKVKSDPKRIIDTETGEITDLKVPKVDTQLSARYRQKVYETNTLPDKTIPGQSMSVLEMVERHRKGLPIEQSKGALYQGEELLPDISKMDQIDRQAYVDSVADALVEIKAKISASAKSQKEKDILDRIDLEVRNKLKEMADKQKDRNQVTDLE